MEQGVNQLERRRVFDYNHLPLGTIAAAALDPRTSDPKSLVIDLNPAAREKGGSDKVAVPFELVFGIRRDEVTLSRSLPEIMDLFAHHGSRKIDPNRIEPAVLEV